MCNKKTAEINGGDYKNTQNIRLLLDMSVTVSFINS